MSIHNMLHRYHSIYLLQEREFVKSRENIYKIGRTTQENTKRIAQYPKGSRLMYFRSCNNSVAVEMTILKLFRSKYNPRTDIGSESFEGDYNAMIKDINILLDKIIDYDGDGGGDSKIESKIEALTPDYDLYKSIVDDSDHISSKINELLKETQLLNFKLFATRVDLVEVPQFMFNYFDTLNKKDPIYLNEDIIRSFGYCGVMAEQRRNLTDILKTFTQYYDVDWIQMNNREYIEFYGSCSNDDQMMYPHPTEFKGRNKVKIHYIITPIMYKRLLMMVRTKKAEKYRLSNVNLELLLKAYNIYVINYYKKNTNDTSDKTNIMRLIKHYEDRIHASNLMLQANNLMNQSNNDIAKSKMLIL